MTTLTNEEKINIINQHIKNIDFAIYGFDLDLIQANAISLPDAGQIASINLRISELNAKRSALSLEKDSLVVVE